jgi:glycosyltransferase involved in cell wall biosynthesis
MISVIIPAYRSGKILPTLLNRLEAVLFTQQQDYEIIIVDDCSPDDTWLVLKKLKPDHPKLKIVRLLKNCGQHNALLCGFSIARGDVVVTMDDDLQNLPEDIPKLIAAIDAGFDLAIGSYATKKHSRWRNFAGNMIDNLQRRIFNLPHDFQLTSFRAVRKGVTDNVVAMGGAFPYITAMLLSHTTRNINVPVHHETRFSGQSNYTLKRSLLLAANLLLNYSPYPLYVGAALCFCVLGVSMLLSLWLAWNAFMPASCSIPDGAGTIAAIAFFNGLVLLALVVQSLYIYRLYQQFTRSQASFSIGELHE